MRHLATALHQWTPDVSEPETQFRASHACIAIPGERAARLPRGSGEFLDYSVVRVTLFRNSILLDLPLETAHPDA